MLFDNLNILMRYEMTQVRLKPDERVSIIFKIETIFVLGGGIWQPSV
jgi:hypothetical protein